MAINQESIEKRIADRDQYMAMVLQKLENSSDSEEKQKLIAEYKHMMDLVFEVDARRGFGDFQKSQVLTKAYKGLARIFGEKKMRDVFLAFIIGVIIAMIPSYFYIQSLKDDLPPFQFVPNAIAERKPVYMQIFKTQQEVDAIKRTGIYLSDKAEIGAGVRISTSGLDMYLKRQIDNPESHVKLIPPQLKEKQVINGYTYIPNAIFTVDPAAVQILKKQDQVDAARKMKGLTYKQNLEVGGVIQCQAGIPCYAITKSDAADRLTLKPFPSSKPNDNK